MISLPLLGFWVVTLLGLQAFTVAAPFQSSVLATFLLALYMLTCPSGHLTLLSTLTT